MFFSLLVNRALFTKVANTWEQTEYLCCILSKWASWSKTPQKQNEENGIDSYI